MNYDWIFWAMITSKIKDYLIILAVIFSYVIGMAIGSYLTSSSEPPKVLSNYSFKDEVEFVDKNTNSSIQTIKNIEFRYLQKDTIMYLVKLPPDIRENAPQEVLVMDEMPPNSYLRIKVVK